MMTIKYTKEHEWLRVEGNIGTVGISDYAQEQLGDIVFVELPEITKKIIKSDTVAVVESVKAASEIYAPVGGEICEVNQALEDNPEKVNAAAMDGGWFFKLEINNIDDLDDLMDEATYKEYVEGLE